MTRTSGTTPVPSCTLVLVRHAHTEMAGRFCGISDPPLSSAGIAQLAGLNEKLRPYPVTHVFSSTLQRARQTAESIAQRRGLQVQYVEVLHELAFGSWEGLDWDEIMTREPEYAQRWLDLYPFIPAPAGEEFTDFLQRIQSAMTSIATQIESGCALVITHAGVIRTFLGNIARQQGGGLDLTTCDYTSCWEIRREAGQWRLPQGDTPAGVAGSAQPSSVGPGTMS